ncbi:serine protease SohB [Sedimentitalea nanhaiensis]|uniref:Serine protease SohB n=2 Tax=Sedimentitalea nanhaiensis TaxID=999627 RepID=A0A1I7CVH5_9RHOB|nr:serine protease SohB [Sedimentitalea nanhaiensis]
MFVGGRRSTSAVMNLRIPFLKNPPLVSVVRLTGAIGMSGRGALNDHAIAPLLEKAFKRGKPAMVALEINSPGGSPVQSSLIGARILRLSQETKVPVTAFVEDVAASGGYWLAAAADEIWADESSVIGSIGVISAGFGAHVFLARQGVERRVYTAGKSKSMLDPFRPENEEDVARLKVILGDIHDNFIAHVKSRRGDKLDTTKDLFTGEFWLARRAADRGLIDGIGHMKPKMQERFGDKVQFRQYARRRPLLSRFGAQLADDAVTGIEERAAYARFGL